MHAALQIWRLQGALSEEGILHLSAAQSHACYMIRVHWPAVTENGLAQRELYACQGMNALPAGR